MLLLVMIAAIDPVHDDPKAKVSPQQVRIGLYDESTSLKNLCV